MTKNFIQQATQAVSFKLGVIAFLALILLIPAQMIRSLVEERQMRRDEVVQELTKKLGKKQTITGPVLSVPYRTYRSDGAGERKAIWHHMHFLPETLNVQGNLSADIRYRSIYKVIGYNSRLEFTGKFTGIDIDDGFINPEDIFWERASLSLGISDMRGINENIAIEWDQQAHPFSPGLPTRDVVQKGVSIPLPVQPRQTHEFSFALDLNGSESLHIVPVGSKTNIRLQSQWDAPGFTGAYLPDERNVTDDGFTAKWKVLELNRSYPQSWADSQYTLEESALGVDLIMPVDIYRKNMRSVKYALLFIALTFLVFFFTEYLNDRRVHPIHYLLAGFGIVLFYSLLLSLSEHLAFGLSYLIASAAIVALITSYFHAIIGKIRATLSVLGILAGLYGFLYILLSAYDYSLLLGNIGLFIILAIVMFFSRKIDWEKRAAEA
jgi:inner membrane protein